MALEPQHDQHEDQLGDPQDPLERARRAAREDEPEGWVEVADTVMTRVRAVLPAEPVLAFSPAGSSEQDDAGSTTQVSSRIVREALRRVLRQPTHAPESIDLTITDGRLQQVSLALVCTYGVDLLGLADTVRTDVLAELVALLGPDPLLTEASIAVSVVDVVVGDPHLV